MLTGFLRRRSCERTLHAHVRGHPAFGDFRIERVIKTGPKQITAVAILSGRRVVIKRSLEPGADRQVLEAKQELDLVAAAMGDGPYRINECVAVHPELGIIVLAFVPGIRLDHAIRQADAQARSALMTQSGGWLRSYCSPRSDIADGFAPEWWIKQRIAAFDGDRPERARASFDALLACVKARAPAVRGQRVTKAATHGDFASINAHYHEGKIYGVDIQGRARLPVVQDVAKFLTWTQAQTPLEPPVAPAGMAHVHGIAAPDLSAFLASGVLPSDEAETLLPFFIGLNMLKCIGDFQSDPGATAHTERMIAHYMTGDT